MALLTVLFPCSHVYGVFGNWLEHNLETLPDFGGGALIQGVETGEVVRGTARERNRDLLFRPSVCVSMCVSFACVCV